MTNVPINPTLQKSYRDTLQIPSAPAFIDTDKEIIPVAVVAQTSDVSQAQNVKITDGTDTVAVSSSGELHVAPIPDAASDLRTGQLKLTGVTETDVFQAASGESVIIDEIHIDNQWVNVANCGCTVKVTDSSNVLIKTLFSNILPSNLGGVAMSHAVLKLDGRLVLTAQQKIRMLGGAAGVDNACNVIGHV